MVRRGEPLDALVHSWWCYSKAREGELMSDIVPLRVVATHDFYCSYLPSPTSSGSLPGGKGLRRTVDRLRDEGPTIWADAGDFAAPGALATLSGGEAGLTAAADLGVDVGVVGNHEFEGASSTCARARPKRAPAPVRQLSGGRSAPDGGHRDGCGLQWLRRPDLSGLRGLRLGPAARGRPRRRGDRPSEAAQGLGRRVGSSALPRRGGLALR